MKPQNCYDWQHPDTTMKPFKALLYNMDNTTHHVAMYSGTQGYIKNKSHNTKSTWDL
jgi:hypothetical protein